MKICKILLYGFNGNGEKKTSPNLQAVDQSGQPEEGEGSQQQFLSQKVAERKETKVEAKEQC